MNNANSFLTQKKLEELIKANKLTKIEKSSFSFEEEFFPFLNLSLSKSFTNEKKIVILKLLNKDHEKNWKVLEANLALFETSDNFIVIITTDKLFDFFKTELTQTNFYAFTEFKKRELSIEIKLLLKTKKIKEEPKMIKKLVSFKDINFIDNEINKISLLPKTSKFTFKDVLYVSPESKQYDFFHNFFFMEKASFSRFLEEVIKKETIFRQLDFFIKNLNKIILYNSWKQYFLRSNRKSDFTANKLYKEYENILSYYPIEVLQEIHFNFINLRKIYLKNKNQEVHKLIIQKLLLLSIRTNRV